MAEEPQKQNLVVYGLAGLLVVAAFGLGSLWTRVQQLEQGKNQKVLAGQEADTDQPTAQAPEPKAAGDVPPVTDEDHIRGSRDAEIVLVEYSDFECPFCSRFHPTMEQVMAEYGDQVAWVYRHYPLSSIHPYAQKAAEASECVAELGGNDAFWQFADAVFEQQGPSVLSVDGLTQLASGQGINQAAFSECLESGKYAQKVEDQLTGGQQAGVTGTPGTILINNNGNAQLISGALPFEQVKQAIDANL